MELKALDNNKAQAIIKACDEILEGKLLEESVIETINSGAGTAFNMNTNEVIANRALEILGKTKGRYEIMSPNDHVNMSQSSNDTFPTAMHVAILLNMNETLASLDKLIGSLQKKAEEICWAHQDRPNPSYGRNSGYAWAEFEHGNSLTQARARLCQAMDGLG